MFYIKRDNDALLSAFVIIGGIPYTFWVAQKVFAMKFETEISAKQVVEKLPIPAVVIKEINHE